MYKLYKCGIENSNTGVMKINADSITSIPFDPANTDYANFKTAILEDKAQLADADGNTMTAEQAKDFVKELP